MMMNKMKSILKRIILWNNYVNHPILTIAYILYFAYGMTGLVLFRNGLSLSIANGVLALLSLILAIRHGKRFKIQMDDSEKIISTLVLIVTACIFLYISNAAPYSS